MTYMKLTKINKYKHIEQYNNDINEKIVKYNYKEWQKIESGLIEFANYYEKYIF
jgi:hypothetical protein